MQGSRLPRHKGKYLCPETYLLPRLTGFVTASNAAPSPALHPGWNRKTLSNRSGILIINEVGPIVRIKK
jgi:hypothetical protein